MKRNFPAVGRAALLTLALLLPAACPAAAAEAETEETFSYFPYVVLQGVADDLAWTVFMDMNSEQASVCMTSFDAEYVGIVYGPFTMEDGELTITDVEDGNDYYFSLSDISCCETSFSYASGDTEVSLALSRVDPTIAELVSTWSWYGALADDGRACTIGFDADLSEMLVSVYSPDDETLTPTITDYRIMAESITETSLSGVAVDLLSNEYDFLFDVGTDGAVTAAITIGDETFEASLVNPGVFPEYEAGESETEAE